MDIITGLIAVLAVYLWFYFIDTFLKSCSHYPYIRFLKGTGLEIKFLHFRWSTTAFNNALLKLGSSNIKFFNRWFAIGLYISLIFLPISILILFTAVIQNFSTKTATSRNLIIEPVIPGINLPASELSFYSLTLLFCSIVHELGHALAAVQEDVNLISVGLNTFFVLPVAYVNINGDKLFSLNKWKSLKILCAGIWHNLLTCFAFYILLLLQPIFFSPFFYYANGITVSHIHEKSPLFGARGLSSGDVIIKINDHVLKNEESWYDYLNSQPKNSAFCIETDLVHNLDESVPLKHLENGLVECCHKENVGNLCFEYIDAKDSILELPPYVCLPARTISEKSKNYCAYPPHICPQNSFCFKAILSNATNLYKIKRVQKNDVIYIGLPSDLIRTISVSSYVPKYLFSTTAVPDFIAKCLHYIVVFSFSLAMINALPCLFMDGQHIVKDIFYLVFLSRLRPDRINLLTGIVSVFFTFLLVVHVLYTIWTNGLIAL